MQNLSFCALVRFPSSAYFEFNTALNGIATVDSLSREENDYSANISFNMKELPVCIAAVTACAGSIVEIVQDRETTPTVVRNFIKKRKIAAAAVTTTTFPKSSKTKTKTSKIDELKSLISSDWKSVKELMKVTGWPPSTIHARFTGMKKLGLLRSKNGPTGRMVYRLKASKAA